MKGCNDMKYSLTVALILIFVPLNVNSEVFRLIDGRSVDLKSIEGLGAFYGNWRLYIKNIQKKSKPRTY